MAKITVAVAKKKGGPDYSSTMYSLSTEVDVPIEGEQDYVDKVAALFKEVEVQVDQQLAQSAPRQTHPTSRRDFWAAGSGGNGGNGHGGNGGHAAPQERNRSHGNTNPSGGNGGQTQTQTVAVTPQAPAQQPADGAAPCTPKQAQFLFKLARKAGMTTQSELNGWIGTSLGVAGKTVYQLTRAEASKAIDILNGKEAAPR